MKLLGINGNSHDNSVFIIDTNEKKIFGIDVERVTRIKHDHGDVSLIKDKYPQEFTGITHFAIANMGGDELTDINIRSPIGRGIPPALEADLILRKIYKPKYYKDYNLAIKDIRTIKGIVKSGPILWSKYVLFKLYAKYNKNNSDLNAVQAYFKNKLKLKPEIQTTFYDHHLCHAASSYYFAPINVQDTTLSVTMDGYGDGYFSKVFLGRHNKLELLGGSRIDYIPPSEDIINNHISLGILYSNFTEALGLRPNSDEGKVEALAAYGTKDNPIFNELLGTYQIDETNYSIVFKKDKILKYYSKQYLSHLIKQHGEKDFAAAIQQFLNTVTAKYFTFLKEKTGATNLTLSGGVTANVIMNLNIFENVGFDNIYIFPAMADNGVAAGAAVLAGIESKADLSWLREKKMPYWGPQISDEEILQTLEALKNKGTITYIKEENWPKIVAHKLASGKIGSLVQGNMEYGPRALGNRSIIADPRKTEIRDVINSKVKGRPWYQPFCPSVLEEERERLFEKTYPNKHMTFAFRLKEKYIEEIPSAAHIDGTARPQFVEKVDNPKYWELLNEVKDLTGFGIIINTSFNLHGRTIVATAEDALTDFLDCKLDFLVLGNYIVERNVA